LATFARILVAKILFPLAMATKMVAAWSAVAMPDDSASSLDVEKEDHETSNVTDIQRVTPGEAAE